jgi:hypothetical protein
MRIQARVVSMLVCLALYSLVLSGCPAQVVRDDKPVSAEKSAAPGPARQKPPDLSSLPKLSRDNFNRIAALLDLPLFWGQDSENRGVLDPNELVLLGVATNRAVYVKDNKFTANYTRTVRMMIEFRRREAVARELNYGRPTLVVTDFSKASDTDKAIVEHITRAARIIEELHGLQIGSFQIGNCLLSNDQPSRAVFRRNQGPWCEAPLTQSDPFCNACPSFPKRVSGLYPPKMSADPKMCEKLAAHPDAKKIFDPFVVIRGSAEKIKVVPYNKQWPQRMNQVAAELRAAAKAIGPEKEKAFKAYLLAAAKGFETNQWEAVDEAWAAMNATNSSWYLRIAPDEVYFEPCNRKAGFHVSFAKIDPDSLYWQEKLVPLREEMEKTLADLIGPSYTARKVSFHMPDFIEIILNAGDARHATGATIGQSLPNWGKVASEGRGRTVVMSNLYTDPDSLAVTRARGDALLSKEAMRAYTEDKRLTLLDIILHEATHNFGPHSDFKVDGKRPGDLFGGALATILEELKAQTGALYYVDFLKRKGVLSADDASRVYNHAIRWCFGHISRGMFSGTGRPLPYSQVAAIHIASLVKGGALVWQPNQPAANGTDQGRFEVHYDKIPAVIDKLMQLTGQIKAKGDKAAGQKLIDECVKGEGFKMIHSQEIADRILRFPKASFVYSITY